jgi:LuxR family maltose regulon positive regulatory protein
LVDESRLHGYASTALTHATAARVALAQGDHVRSRRSLDEAVSGRPLLTVAIPTFAMRARLEMARSAMGLGDADLARLALDEGADLLRRRPRLGTLVDEFESVARVFEERVALDTGLPPLSPAESRLLPLLTTHMTFREIGEQLFISPHTVKTQAISIYRKLGVSSRSTAIEAARELGLLSL